MACQVPLHKHQDWDVYLVSFSGFLFLVAMASCLVGFAYVTSPLKVSNRVSRGKIFHICPSSLLLETEHSYMASDKEGCEKPVLDLS